MTLVWWTKTGFKKGFFHQALSPSQPNPSHSEESYHIGTEEDMRLR